MSIQSDIVTSLATVAGGRVYPQGEIPEKTVYPLVFFRRTNHNRIQVMQGYSGISISEFTFECWGAKTDTLSAKASALAIATDIRTAFAASVVAGTLNCWDIPISGEDYDDQTLEEMEPVGFGFQHT